MKVIVQKFGGSSLDTPEHRRQACARVAESRRDGLSPVVVVSAMGRGGDPYATDTLLEQLRSCQETDARETDMLVTCGETISAVLMAHLLRDTGVPAVALTGGQAGIITDESYGDAKLLYVEPRLVQYHLKNGQVPVVAGFQGISLAGNITSLGRGGSDTTAVALGVALGTETVEVYTDVDGVMTADPKLEPSARLLPKVEFEELFNLAHEGAKIVHGPAAEMAKKHELPLWVKNTATSGPGTLVCRADELTDAQKVVTAITHIPGLCRFRVELDRNVQAEQREIFEQLAAAGISLDMFTCCGRQLIFNVGRADQQQTRRVLGRLARRYQVDQSCAKVTAVGGGMRGVPGVMARVAAALGEARVDILQIADSHCTISCLVPEAKAPEAVRALHEAFGLAETETSPES